MTDLRSRVRDHWDSLSRAERDVASMLSESSSEELLWATAASLGTGTGTSNATAIRTLQRLGYAGLADLKRQIATPGAIQTPEERIRARIGLSGDSVNEMIDAISDESVRRIQETRRRANAHDVRVAIDTLFAGRTIHTYGVGSSAFAAAYLALHLARCGKATHHLDADGFRLADALLAVRRDDVVVLFSPGRASSDIMAILARTREVGAQSVLLTDDLRAELADSVTVVLDAPNTSTGLTSEALTAILLSDLLIQGITRLAPDAAVETSHALGVIRARLGYPRN